MSLPSRGIEALPTAIAHRGLSAHAPENTLAAIRAAHDVGCRWVELDVQLLGDGTPVIWHDADVERCSNGHGYLNCLTFDQVRELDVGRWFDDRFIGERIATLDAALALLAELDMGLNLEFKLSPGHDAKALVTAALPVAMASLPAERLLFSSFSSQALQIAHDYYPEAALGLLYETLPDNWAARAEAVNAVSVHVDWRFLTREAAEEVKAKGCQLLCYTVNDASAFKPYWNWGVAAAISDDPAIFSSEGSQVG